MKEQKIVVRLARTNRIIGETTVGISSVEEVIPSGEYLITKSGKIVKVSGMGDEYGIDFIHTQDNMTIIQDQDTGETIDIRSEKS